jgi:hypothetical protein
VTFQCEDNDSGIATCSGPVLVDTEGENQEVTGTAVDRAGNTASVTVTLNLDKTAPILSEYLPSDGDTLPDPEVNLTGKIGDTLSGVAAVTCDANGTSDEAVINEGIVDDDVFACSLPLVPGSNVVTVEGADIGGNVTSSVLTIYHTLPPTVAIDSPGGEEIVSSSPVTVTGTIDDSSATVTVNDVPATVANGFFTASVPLVNGVNTITALAQNVSGSGSASVSVLAIVGLNPTVTIVSPGNEFVLGKQTEEGDTEALPVIVKGWVRDNRVLVTGTPVVTVWFNNTPIAATVTQQTSGLCRPQNRCWTYSATQDFPPPEQVNLSIEVEAKTGDLTATGMRSGIVDFCYRNNASTEPYVACDACLFQRPGRELVLENRQSRRCIQNADGCSAPLGPLANNPTQGKMGLTSTAFGRDEDPDTPEGAFTVFGQPRPIQLPCNRHDECYHQWCPQVLTRRGVVAEKYDCNKRFLDDMIAVCKKAYPETVCPSGRIGLLNCPQWRIEKRSCYSWAVTYYGAVNADADRFLFKGPYKIGPYQGGYLTPCEGCPEIQ